MTPTTFPGTGDTDGTLETEAVDWTDAGTFARAEEARITEADDESLAVEDLVTLPDEADEADVLEQFLEVGDDDEEDAPRG